MVFKNGNYSEVLQQLFFLTQRQCGPVGLLVDVFILRLQGCKQQLHPAAFARCGRSLAGREGLGNLRRYMAWRYAKASSKDADDDDGHGFVPGARFAQNRWNALPWTWDAWLAASEFGSRWRVVQQIQKIPLLQRYVIWRTMSSGASLPRNPQMESLKRDNLSCISRWWWWWHGMCWFYVNHLCVFLDTHILYLYIFFRFYMSDLHQ